MNIVLLAAQVLLALAFLSSGGMKIFANEKYREMGKRSPDDSTLPKSLVTFIGVAEVAGALGVILPTATGIAPGLTPIAAAALALVMLLAIGFHINRKDSFGKTIVPIVLLALSLFVAIGRGLAR